MNSHPDQIDDSIDRMLVNLYLGQNTTEKDPEWRAQMKNPELAQARAAMKRLVLEGRLAEDRYLASCTDSTPLYIYDRIKHLESELKALQGKEGEL